MREVFQSIEIGNNSVNPREKIKDQFARISTDPSIDSVTRRFAMLLIKRKQIPPANAISLMACAIWHHSGSLSKAGELLGVDKKRAEWMVDEVGDNDALTKQYERLSALSRLDEFKALLEQHLSYTEIVSEMGITMSDVFALAGSRIFEAKNLERQRLKRLRIKRSRRRGANITNKKRYEEYIPVRAKIIELRTANPNITNRELEAATRRGKTTVENLNGRLLKKGILVSHLELQQRAIDSRLEELIDKFVYDHPGAPISLWGLKKDNNLTWHYRTIQKSYQRIRSRKNIPPTTMETRRGIMKELREKVSDWKNSHIGEPINLAEIYRVGKYDFSYEKIVHMYHQIREEGDPPLSAHNAKPFKE